MTDNQPRIILPESAFNDNGYTVELGGQRFTDAQWEALQPYIEARAGARDSGPAVPRILGDDEYAGDLSRAVFEALGAASVCWDTVSAAGVFDSTRAKQIGEELLDVIRAHFKGHKAQHQVRAFHEAMGQPAPLDGPRPLPADRVAVRIELIREEFIDELIPALGARVAFHPNGSIKFWDDVDMTRQDTVEVADAATDILYVVYGLLVEMGIDAESLFDEVQASNMSKLGADGKAIIAQENDPDGIFPGRVKKGPNYFKPDLARVLSEQALKAGAEEDPLAYYNLSGTATATTRLVE